VSLAGWLVRQGVGLSLPACRVRLLHAMRLNYRAGTEGSPVSSLNCERPSHPDWGRLGVVRAAGVDNRWQGPVVLLGRPHVGTCQRTCRLSWVL